MTTGRQEQRKGMRYEGTTRSSRRRCVSSPRYVLLLLLIFTFNYLQEMMRSTTMPAPTPPPILWHMMRGNGTKMGQGTTMNKTGRHMRGMQQGPDDGEENKPKGIGDSLELRYVFSFLFCVTSTLLHTFFRYYRQRQLARRMNCNWLVFSSRINGQIGQSWLPWKKVVTGLKKGGSPLYEKGRFFLVLFFSFFSLTLLASDKSEKELKEQSHP